MSPDVFALVAFAAASLVALAISRI